MKLKLLLTAALLAISAGSFAATCAESWTTTKVYKAKMTASYEGKNYSANWWNQNTIPAQNSSQWGVWRDLGSCTGSSATPTPSPTSVPTAKPTLTPVPTSTPIVTATPTVAPTSTPTTRVRHEFVISNDPEVRAYAGQFISGPSSCPSIGDSKAFPAIGTYFEFVKNDGQTVFTLAGSTVNVSDIWFLANGKVQLSRFDNIQTNYPVMIDMNDVATIDIVIKPSDYIGIEIIKAANIFDHGLVIRQNGAVMITASIPWFKGDAVGYINTSVNCVLTVNGCGARVYDPFNHDHSDQIITSEYLAAHPDFLKSIVK